MLALKDNSVKLPTGIALMFAMTVVDQIYEANGVETTVITSGQDGKHSLTSLHYAGQAFDVRTWNIPKGISPKDIVRQIKAKLNIHFDVVLESDHIHVEFQPRYSE